MRTRSFYALIAVSYVVLVAISLLLLGLFLAPIEHSVARTRHAPSVSTEALVAAAHRNRRAVNVALGSTLVFLLLTTVEPFLVPKVAESDNQKVLSVLSVALPFDVYINSATTLYSLQLPFVGRRALACAARACSRARAGAEAPPPESPAAAGEIRMPGAALSRGDVDLAADGRAKGAT